jgi:hypothetical protein
MENSETKKVSKKALRSLLKDSMQESLGHLALPKANKRVKKIISRSTKKMAAEFAQLLKKDFKRAKPAKARKSKTEATLVAAQVA